VQLSAQGDGFVIDRIALRPRAVVPDLDEARSQEIAAPARSDRPLPVAHAGIAKISLAATLGPGSQDKGAD
jgi:osmotically inducible protein OsmC